MRRAGTAVILPMICAGQALGQGSALLEKIKTRVRDNLERLPNYTCRLTVERSHRPSPRRPFELEDAMRLDVLLADGKELYGWAGAKQIFESDLSKMAPGGAIGNGSFALIARSIFLSTNAQCSYVSQTELAGSHAEQYDYQVLQQRSQYHLQADGRQAVVGYHGSFWVDASTLDLMRVEMIADSIPPALRLISVNTVVAYQKVRIGENDFLLPGPSEQLLTDKNGSQERNRMQFDSCRQYSGEAKLALDDPPSEDSGKPSFEPDKTLILPQDFEILMRLSGPIDMGSSFEGDPVEFRIEREVKKHGRLVLPKDSMVTGRIVRFRRRNKLVELAFSMESIDCGLGHADLTARNNSLTALGIDELESQSRSTAVWDTLGASMILKQRWEHIPPGFVFRWRSQGKGPEVKQ